MYASGSSLIPVSHRSAAKKLATLEMSVGKRLSKAAGASRPEGPLREALDLQRAYCSELQALGRSGIVGRLCAREAFSIGSCKTRR